jgi:hypothetical protein
MEPAEPFDENLPGISKHLKALERAIARGDRAVAALPAADRAALSLRRWTTMSRTANFLAKRIKAFGPVRRRRGETHADA